MEGVVDNSLLAYGAASFTRPGQTETGDLYLVSYFPGGALAAVVDGLGHGAEAAVAARTAIEILQNYQQESVVSLVRRCHQGLKTTRGAVMSLASFDAAKGTVTWIGVGNVMGVLIRGDNRGGAYEFLVMRSGVVGDQLPTLWPSVVAVHRDDLLIFATDGVRGGFAERVRSYEPPQRIAGRIIAEYARGTDDAQVLALRFTQAVKHEAGQK